MNTVFNLGLKWLFSWRCQNRNPCVLSFSFLFFFLSCTFIWLCNTSDLVSQWARAPCERRRTGQFWATDPSFICTESFADQNCRNVGSSVLFFPPFSLRTVQQPKARILGMIYSCLLFPAFLSLFFFFLYRKKLRHTMHVWLWFNFRPAGRQTGELLLTTV